ncbi:MAG: hypothetical protein AAGI28_01015 [Pseudomonadota bacterium]
MPVMTIRLCAPLAVLATVLTACNPAAQAALDGDYVAMTTKVQPVAQTRQNKASDLRNRPHDRPSHASVLLVSHYEDDPFTGRATVDWESYFRP